MHLQYEGPYEPCSKKRKERRDIMRKKYKKTNLENSRHSVRLSKSCLVILQERITHLE